MRAYIAVEHQHDLRRGERADRNEDHARSNQVKPDQQRHPVQLHAWAAHADRCRDDVQRRTRSADSAEQNRQRPVVRAVAR